MPTVTSQSIENNLNVSPNVLGFNTLLIGPPGSGKTTSIPTLLKTGLEVFVIFTETGVTQLLKACKLHNCTEEEMARLHYKYIKPGAAKFKTLSEGARKVQTAKEFGKMTGGSRANYGQLIEVMRQCENFVDQHGESFGPVDDWDASRVLVIDGLTGLNIMAMDIVVGDKPVKTLQEWGVAIDQAETFIRQCTDSLCNFVLLGHLEQEKDEVTGSFVVTASCLGRKLGTKIGQRFSDVVLASGKDGKFTWSTKDRRVDLKATNLPITDNIDPNFARIFDPWATENNIKEATK